MSHIFISHVEEDADVALQVALKLEEAGYTTWCYELDSIPGPSYLLQTGTAIEQSKAVILVISPHSLGSRQVTREVVRAHESGIYFIPVLRNITHVEFQNRQPEWREALGSATSTLIPQEGITGILDRIIGGLKALGINPTSKPDVSRLERIRRMLNEIQSRGVMKEGTGPDLKSPALPIPSTKAVGRAGGKWLNRLRARWVWAVAVTFVIMVAVIGSWLYLNVSGGEGEPVPELSLNLVGTYSTSREANSIFVVGDVAYVANGGDGLLVLDVSLPSEPKKIGQYPPETAENNVRNVVVVDNIAYVIEQGGLQGNGVLYDKLVLLDVGIPSNPIKVGEYEQGALWSLDKIAVVGNVVYLTAFDKLTLLDVSVSSSPVKLGEFEFNSNVANPGVVVTDNVAYVMANDLHLIDVRDPSKPVQIGQFDTSDWGSGIAVVDGEIAYVVGWSAGLEIIDVSVPSQPVKIGRYTPVGRHELIPPGAEGRYTAMEVSVVGDIAYLTYIFGIEHETWIENLESGVIAIDISDPQNPTKIAEYSGMEEVSGVFALGDLIFSTDTTRGVFIFSLDELEGDH